MPHSTAAAAASSPSKESLKHWVHATNHSTRRFLRQLLWSSSSSSPRTAPMPASTPVRKQQDCYTCYDSDEDESDADHGNSLEMMNDFLVTDDPDLVASYRLYTSQKSGSGA